MDKKLVMQVELPFYARRRSQLYRLFSVPIIKNGMKVLAKLDAPYLIFNMELDAYHPMSKWLFKLFNKSSEYLIVQMCPKGYLQCQM